jgi:glycogen synthase
VRIGFISYEMPPATGGGGIGTYLTNVLPMLMRGGHDVELFAGAGAGADGSRIEEGITIHRVGRSVPEFLERVGDVIGDRHRALAFDVLEAPEFYSQSKPVQAAAPNVPLVIKLHTPMSVVEQLNYTPYTAAMRLRRTLGAFRRLQWPEASPRAPKVDWQSDPEREAAVHADQISAPSSAIWERLEREWKLDPAVRFDVPLPYAPSERLLALSTERSTRTILFLGRLEVRKGIIELAKALPEVLSSDPAIRMMFVGRPLAAPDGRGSFADWLRRKLSRYAGKLDFVDHVPQDQLPGVFGSADVAVFPSRWESFGYVCLEAMAAGCGVLASRDGGMAELLDGGRCGVLVDPSSSSELSVGIRLLLENPGARQRLAVAARERVLQSYSPAALLKRYEEGYQLAIDRRHSRGGLNGQHSGASASSVMSRA